jgi:ectoine hydroxylase-related dioxygenase (phytanoyl-CoA dioxygenase family)
MTTQTAPPLAPNVEAAIESIGKIKSGFLPPFLTRAELDECLAAWERLYTDPDVKIANQRFIVDHKLYLEPIYSRVATHPAVQRVVTAVIGEFQLAGMSIVATPNNGATPSTIETTPLHVDHCVYSDTPVHEARDTFVCVWVNFEELAMENGPFALGVGTDKFNVGWEFFKARPNLTVKDMRWDNLIQFNTGPAGSTAVYSGKTWHSATTNSSQKMRKGLNMNFVPRHPLDTLKRNPFDACALSADKYERFAQLLGTPGYVIDRIPSMSA